MKKTETFPCADSLSRIWPLPLNDIHVILPIIVTAFVFVRHANDDITGPATEVAQLQFSRLNAHALLEGSAEEEARQLLSLPRAHPH